MNLHVIRCQGEVFNRLTNFKGKDYFPPDRGGKTSVVTKEGQVAVRDAIAYLESSGRLGAKLWEAVLPQPHFL